MGGQGVSTSCRESIVYLLSIYYILLLYVCVFEAAIFLLSGTGDGALEYGNFV